MTWLHMVLRWAIYWLLLNGATFIAGGREFRGVNLILASTLSFIVPFLFIMKRETSD